MRQRVKGLLALFLVFAMVFSCQPSAVRAEESINILYMNADPSNDGDSRFDHCARNVAFGTPLNAIADSIGVQAPAGYTIKGWKVWGFGSGLLLGEPYVYESADASISYDDYCNLSEQARSCDIYAEAILEKPALEGTVTLMYEGEEAEILRYEDVIEASADIVSPVTPGALSYSFWRQTENGEQEKIADEYRLWVEEEVGTVIWAEVTAENASGSIKSREYTVQKGLYSQYDVSLNVNDEYYSNYNGDRDTLNWWAPEYSEGKIQYRIKENGTWSDWTENIGTHDGSGAYTGSIIIGNVNRAVGDIEVREVDNDSYENRDPAYVWTNEEPFTAVEFSLTGGTKVGDTLTANLVLDERNFSCINDPDGTHKIFYTFKRGDVVVREESEDATYTITQDDIGSTITVYATVEFFYNGNPWMTYDTITASCNPIGYEPLSGTATIIASSGEELSGLEIPYGTSLEVRLEGTTAAMGEECSYQWYCLAQGAETPEVIRVYNNFSHYAWENVKVGDTLWAEITGAGGGTVATPEYTVTKGYYYIEDTYQMSLDMYGMDALFLGVDPSVLVGVDFEYRIRESADVVWPEEWTACELVVGEYIVALATVGNNDIPADCVQIRPKETEYFSVHPDDIDTYLWTNDAPFTKAEVSLTGTAKIGETLTAEVSLPDDANFPDTEGNGTQSVIYTFKRGATTVQEGEENTYVIQPADAGSVITVEVKVVYTYSDPESETVTYGPLTANGVAVPGVYSEADFRFTVDNELYDEYGNDKMDWIANKKTEGKIQYRVKNSNGVWSDWMDSTGYEVGNGAAYEGVIEIGNVTLGAGDIEIRIPDNDCYANPDPDNPIIWTNDENYLFTAVNVGLTGNAKVGEILTANLTLDERNFPYIAYPEFIKYEVSYKFIGVGETGSETELQNSTAATYTVQQTDVGLKIKVEITVTMSLADGSDAMDLEPLTVIMDEKVAATATPTTAPIPITTPTPTRTPVITMAPRPTRTPVATMAPVPTATPIPTATPLPTVTPAPEVEEAPNIQGEDGKSGWEVISDEIRELIGDMEDPEDDEGVTVDMNGTTEVPKEIFELIAGKNITVEFVLDNGVKWIVNGMNVKADELKNINFGVTFGSRENSLDVIPAKVINKVTGERTSVELQLAHSGEFGFEAVLTIDLEEKNAGLYANLFFYNEDKGELEFVCVDVIEEDGTVEFLFTHASDYLIVLSDSSMEPAPEVKEPVLKKGYTVQIGAFSSKANAKKWEKKGEAIDIPMFIIEDGKLFRVQTDVFETRAEAAMVAKKLTAAGLRSFILKTERLVTPEGDEAPQVPTKPTKPETPVRPADTDKKEIETIAKEVIAGKWGNGADRKDRLTKAGYDYKEVQAKVNELLK